MDDTEPVNGASAGRSRGLNIEGPILIGEYEKCNVTYDTCVFCLHWNWNSLWVPMSNSDIVQHHAFPFKSYPEKNKKVLCFFILSKKFLLVQTTHIKRVLSSSQVNLRVSLHLQKGHLHSVLFFFCCSLFLP